MGIAKAYGGVRALKGVDLAVRPGTVHGLVGHNGAGKSTLVKIVAGITRADAGEVSIDGERVEIASRRDAIAAGVLSVAQELTVLPGMTVAENVCIGNEPRKGPMLSLRSMRRRADETLGRLGIDISARADVDGLPASHQRMVMIAAALS